MKSNLIHLAKVPKVSKAKKPKAVSIDTLDSIPDHLLDHAEKDAWWKSVRDEGMMADGVSAGIDDYSPHSHHSKGTYKKCAHTHKPLKVTTTEGKEVVVYGGACGDPVHKQLAIYVALDHGTAHDPQAYPWHGSRQFIYFPISDMSVPKDAAEFKRMIDWLAGQIKAGLSVHVGCIGGHGRTGMVLAALVKVLSGNADAITYTRTNYCDKAVETDSQVAWLVKNFGVTSTNKSKQGYSYHGSTAKGKVDYTANKVAKEFGSNTTEVRPFKLAGNIWGLTVA